MNRIIQETKKNYRQAVEYAKNTIEVAERLKNWRTSEEDFDNKEDYEQDQQENADAVLKANVYLQLLINMKSQLEANGINVD